MRIAFFGDSLTEGTPGVSFLAALGPLLAEHELENCGKRGETVVSLHRRILRRHHHAPGDTAVLWIGVNDVLAKLSLGHAMVKRLMNQPPAKDLSEFRDYYRRISERLLIDADRVFAISPLLIGEDLSNRWNRELGDMSASIASVASSCDRVEYIDLRSVIAQRLAASTPSGYVPKRVTAVARDALFLRTPRAVDSASLSRGLRLTLDGVHLNSAGATLVAEIFRQAVRSCSL